MSVPPRHYLFATWEGAGVVSAELAVARRLVERGHRVTVIGDPPVAGDAEAIGAGFRAWDQAPVRTTRAPEAELVADWEVRSPFELMKRMRERSSSTPPRGSPQTSQRPSPTCSPTSS